jgi:hypothetical protein
MQRCTGGKLWDREKGSGRGPNVFVWASRDCHACMVCRKELAAKTCFYIGKGNAEYRKKRRKINFFYEDDMPQLEEFQFLKIYDIQRI